MRIGDGGVVARVAQQTGDARKENSAHAQRRRAAAAARLGCIKLPGGGGHAQLRQGVVQPRGEVSCGGVVVERRVENQKAVGWGTVTAQAGNEAAEKGDGKMHRHGRRRRRDVDDKAARKGPALAALETADLDHRPASARQRDVAQLQGEQLGFPVREDELPHNGSEARRGGRVCRGGGEAGDPPAQGSRQGRPCGGKGGSGVGQ